MGKLKRTAKWLLAVVIVLIVGFAGTLFHRTQAAKKYINSTTPTFFVHGWGSSYHAEQYMANGARNEGITKTIIWANVAKNGHVTFHGNIAKGARNPIIEVNQANSKEENYTKDGQYVYDVVKAAQDKWGFTKMNLVGHSMGNLDIAYYLLKHDQDKNLPTLEHHVAMAGHFNGGIGFGYPKGTKLKSNSEPTKRETHFTELTKLRSTYPRTSKVLNIYGDIKDGSHSDSQVPVNSAKTLRYLVGNRAKSYQEKEFTGAHARHSDLHHNAKVNRVLFNFLWGRSQN